jgi:membrane protease YdiL (CAAX protease family)
MNEHADEAPSRWSPPPEQPSSPPVLPGAEPPPVVATVVYEAAAKTTDVRLRRLRIWPALLVPLLAIPLAALASTLPLLWMTFAQAPDAVQEPQRFEAALEAVLTTPGGFLASLLPGQIVFLLSAVAGAMLSHQPAVQRLSLTTGRQPRWKWLVLIAGTPFIGLVSALTIESISPDLSPNLRLFEQMVRSAQGAMAAAILLTITILPGVSEELLFRGYMQGRLLQRWHPTAAVLGSTLLFAAAHLDPLHIAGVIPLGIWLGVIAWRCGTIWPAVLCHMTNNLLAVLAVWYMDLPDNSLLNHPALLPIAATTGLGFLAAVAALLSGESGTMAPAPDGTQTDQP